MKITEENYVALMKKKNERALQYFIDVHGWIVKSIIHNKLGAYRDLQEECMNDTFLAIWQTVHKYDAKKAAFTTWVAAVTRYQVLKCMRNISSQSMEDIESLDIVGDEDVKIPLMQLDEEQEFRDLLKALSPKDQEIFVRIFWDEQSHAEVANALGMKKEVLYNRLSKGKKKLQKHNVRRRSF